jgi:O-antigen/teichoic acid export membrane protein
LVFARQIAGWFNDPSLSGPVRVAAGIIVCASLYEFFEHFVIGLNRHAVVSKVRSLMLILRIVLSVAIVLAGLGAVHVLGGYCAAWVVAIAVFAAMLLGRLPARDRLDPGERARLVRRLLALSIPLAVSSASVTVYSQIDKLMLGYFNGVEEVGQYAVARAVTEVSLFPAFAFVMTLRPALASRYASGALDECAQLIRNSLRASLAFGVLFAAVYVVFAPPLLEWVYSTEFRYAGTLMTAFVWVLVLRSLGAMVLPALVAAERTKLYAYLTVLSAVINFGLNLVLIPRYQARGAIVATIVSYGFLLVIGLGQTFRIFGVKIRLDAVGGALRTVLAGVAASFLVWLLLRQVYADGKAQPDARVILWVFLLVGVYAALLWMLKVFRTDDVRTVFSSLRHRRRNLK